MTEKCIHFLPSGLKIRYSNEASVLEVALKNELDISHSCGGMGSCTTCRVIVTASPAELPPRNELETDIAEMRGFRDNERLACQLPPSPGLEVRIPDTGPTGLERT